MAKQFTLSRQERLKSRKRIDELFRTGSRIVTPLYRITYLYGPATDAPSIKFGVGAPSRHFKKAVDRNRIKRLTREAWRLQKNELQQQLDSQDKNLHLFFIYTGKIVPLYAEVYAAVEKAIQKLLQQK